MTFEQLVKKFSPTIRRIAYKLNGHFSAFDYDDLYQEALVHLWVGFNKGTLNDKTDSYILQGCYFHLKNYIRTHYDKVSLTSLSALICNGEGEGFDLDCISALEDSRLLRDEVHCKMLIEQIHHNGLTPREKEVFSLVLEGLTVREIGDRLGVSHVRVVKITKNIREKCKKHIDMF